MRRGGPWLGTLLALAVTACAVTPAFADLPDDAIPAEMLPGAPLPPPPAVAYPLSPRAQAALAADRASLASDPRLHASPPPRGQWVEGTFDVRTTDPAVDIQKAVQLAQQTVTALWSGPFSYRPELAVQVWMFSTDAAAGRAIRTYARGVRSDVLGVYDPATRQVFVSTQQGGYFSESHELAHALLDDDWGGPQPTWFSEGLAALFEVPIFSDGQVHFGSHFRLEALRAGLRSAKKANKQDGITLPALVGMTDDTFMADAPLHYAMAREALRWLDTQGKLWYFYHAWRDHVLDDRDGRKALRGVVGDLDEATAAWRAWIASPEAKTR